MSNLRFAACGLVLLCLLPADHFSQTRSKSALVKEGTASVSGRVTLKGEPASGVVVALQEFNRYGPSAGNPKLRAKTDPEGRFRITGVLAGSYLIRALAPGYITNFDGPYGQPWKLINISDGEEIENVDLPLKRGAVITGRVIDSNGRPLVDEGIDLIRIAEQGDTGVSFSSYDGSWFTTDDRGVYRIYGLPAGRYLASVGFETRPGSIAIAPGRTFFPKTFHPDVNDRAQAKIIELEEGAEAEDIDITVGEAKKAFAVSGRVIDADTGRPLAGLMILYGAYLPGSPIIGGMGSRGDRTGAEGEFDVYGIPPGKYSVFTGADENNEYYSEPVPFEIEDADVTGVEIKARHGGAVKGVIVFEGESDPALLTKLTKLRLSCFVYSERQMAPRMNQGQINPDGSFLIKGLQPGKARIMVSPTSDLRDIQLLRVEKDGVLQSEGVQIGPGEQVTNVRLVITHGTGRVRGRLQIIGGTLPPDLRVAVQAIPVDRKPGFERGGEIDVRGNFMIESLAPGAYEIRLSPMIYTTNPGSLSPARQRLNQLIHQVKENITVAQEGETQVTLVIDLTNKEEDR